MPGPTKQVAFVLGAAMLMASGAAWGQAPDAPPKPTCGVGPNHIYEMSKPMTFGDFPILQPTSLVIGSDTKHQITIHLDTGKIDYPGAPDKAARAFWEAVKTLMPLYVKCEEKK